MRGIQLVVPVSSTPTLLLGTNSHRRNWTIGNLGPVPIGVSVGMQLPAGQGMVILPGHKPLELREEHYGDFPGLDVWGQTVGNSSFGNAYTTSFVGNNLSGASTGVKLSHVVDDAEPVTLIGATIGSYVTAGATIELQVVRGGVTYTLAAFTGNGTYSTPFALDIGDTVQFNVTVAIAANTFDATFTYQSGNSSVTVSDATAIIWAAED